MNAKVSKELLALLGNYVAERMGLHFPEERWSDLERGLGHAAPDFGFEDAEACARWLLRYPLTKKQIETLAGQLTVGETYFFRDKKSFDLLEGKILPELIQKRRGAEKYLRIWSAGCATGEEPYSVAMLLNRLIPDIGNWNITILATDINTSFLQKATKGVYGEWSFRDVPLWVKERFFEKVGKGRFELLEAVRKGVTFFYHNLAEDAYPSLSNNTNAIDLILCRNVLMYFNETRQMEVVRKLYRCLVNGGCLMVSPAEISSLRSLPSSDAQFSGSILYKKDISGEGASKYYAAICPIDENRIGESPSLRPNPVGQEGYVVPPPFKGGLEGQSELSTPLSVASLSSKEEADSYAEALKLYERGCYSDAEEKISALLAGDENNGPAFALLSRIYANEGRLAEAHGLCLKAISTDKLNPAYQYLLAAILLEMGREDESKSSLKRALYLNQDFALAHYALGNLARRKGMKRESERHFENALSILRKYRPEGIVPESEGITAERMIEIIGRAIPEGTSV